MLNVGKIEEGFVLDHIKAGQSLMIYHHLALDTKDCTVAMIMNAKSDKMGKKDIIKVDAEIELDLNVVGFIAPQATINVIIDEKLTEKRTTALPEKLVNVIKCNIPRCVSQTEQELNFL